MGNDAAMTIQHRLRLAAFAAFSAGLAGCASPPPPPPAAPTVAPSQRLAAIDAAAAAGVAETEQTVQPRRDPQGEDLRESAQPRRQAGDLAGAAALLDQALGIVANDPGVLQERAEIALLQGDDAAAERYAKQAIDLGSKTGPLCRRHWATIEQSRLARGEQQNADSAHAQIASCTVPGVKRY